MGILIGIGIGLCIFGFIGFFMYRVLHDMRPSKGSRRERKAYQSTFADIDLPSPIRRGRIFRAKEPKGIIVLLHNWGAARNRFYPVADALAEAGFHVLLYDLRGHGENWAILPFWLFGVAPGMRRDLRKLISWIREQPEFAPLPISLMGYSMGSGVVFEVFKHDPSIGAVICDSGPFSLKPSVCHLLIDRTIPDRSWFVRTVVNWGFCLIVNIPHAYRVLKNLEKCRGRKILLIASGRETFITTDELEAIPKLLPEETTYVCVDQVQHLMAFALEGSAYVERIRSFLLGEPKSSSTSQKPYERLSS